MNLSKIMFLLRLVLTYLSRLSWYLVGRVDIIMDLEDICNCSCPISQMDSAAIRLSGVAALEVFFSYIRSLMEYQIQG